MKQHLLGIGLAMALVAAGRPVPQRHLEPEDSGQAGRAPMRLPVFSDYRRTLGPVLDSSVRVFMVTEGTPFPESVIGLKRASKGWRIFGAQATVASRPPREKRAGLPPEPAALKTCDAAIDPILATMVIDAWDAVLMQTRPGYGPATMATDGGIRHFGSRRKDRVLTGHDASYIAQDSNPAWLGKIAYDLTAICNKWKSPGSDSWAEMRHAVGRINLKSEAWPRGKKPWYAP